MYKRFYHVIGENWLHEDLMLRQISEMGYMTIHLEEIDKQTFIKFANKICKTGERLFTTRIPKDWIFDIKSTNGFKIEEICGLESLVESQNIFKPFGGQLNSAINDYHERTGYSGEIDIKRMIERAKEEISELEESIEKGESREDQLMEMADVFHFLFCAIKGYGIESMDEAIAVFQRKNHINQMRLQFGKGYDPKQVQSELDKYWYEI